jgi:hypothetical protein
VFGAPIMPWRPFAATPVLSIAQPGRLVIYAYLVIAVIVARWLANSSWRPQPAPKPSPYPPSSPLWRPTPLPRRSWRPLGWLPVLLAALTILPNFTAARWTTRVPMPPFLAEGAYRHTGVGEIVWLLEIHPDRRDWLAKTGSTSGCPAGSSAAPRRASRKARCRNAWPWARSAWPAGQ